MPTANVNTGNGFSKAISYALQETKKVPEDQKAEVIELVNVAGSAREMGRQMRELSNDRATVKKPVLHLQINFHPTEKPSREQAGKAVDGILKEIGIDKEKHQYIVVQHKDKPHSHYHVIANRVDFEGALLNDHRIKDRLQVACDKIELQQGLRRTKGRTVLYDATNEKGYRYASEVQKAVTRIIQDGRERRGENKTKNPKIIEEKEKVKQLLIESMGRQTIDTPEKLQEALQKKGVDTKFMTNKNGISGVSFRKNEIAIKGTALGYRWKDIATKLEANKALNMAEKTSQGKPDISHSGTFRQPTEIEQREILFVSEYNSALNKAVDDYVAHLKQGQLKVDPREIFTKHGFKNSEDGYRYEDHGFRKTVKKHYFESARLNVIDQYDNFKQSETAYNDLMKQELQRMPALFGREKVKDANEELKRQQRNAEKPIFKPKIYGIQIREHEIRASYDMAKSEHEKAERFKKEMSQGQDRKQGRGRGL